MNFTVAAIVREPAVVIRRFLRWYLEQGAERIILFLDDPTDPLLEELRATPKVEPIICTPDFWAGLNLSPERRFTRRQNAALTAAYRALKEGWLLNVDADEFMHFSGYSLAEAVRHFPDDAACVRVATAEQVHLSDGSEAFRLPIPRDVVTRVYGESAHLFRPRYGLLGHADGKAFHRAGQNGIRLRQHWAEDGAGNQVEALRLGDADGAHLLHFSAPDFASWRAKLEWRLSSANLAAGVREMLINLRGSHVDPEVAYGALWERLYRLTYDQEVALEAGGGLLRLKL